MANKLRECMVIWEEEPGTGKWSVLAFDGVVKESHSGAVQITSYPVDSGFMVSDHAIRQNRIIELDTITSNISMSVATSRKTFEESFNELMVAIGVAQQGGAPVYDAGQVFDAENDTLASGPNYDEASKYGRAKYDNDAIDINIPYTSITLGTVTNPIATALLAQVSLEKVDEVLNTIDRLNALGKLVHLVTMRGVRKNCVLRQYDVANDVSNAYCLPASLSFEQLNVVDLTRSTVQTSTYASNGDEVVQEQAGVRDTVEGSRTFVNHKSRRAPQVLAMPKATAPDVTLAKFHSLQHKEVPYSTAFDTRFIHNGTEYTLGKVQYNAAMEQWTTSLRWRGTGQTMSVESIVLASGANLVRQYSTNLPSLVAVNTAVRNSDPTGPENLRLYIIEEFDQTFVEA